MVAKHCTAKLSYCFSLATRTVSLELEGLSGWDFEVKLGFNSLRSGYIAIFLFSKGVIHFVRYHLIFLIIFFSPVLLKVPSLFLTVCFGVFQPSVPLFAVLLPGFPESFKLHLLTSTVEAFFLHAEEEIKGLCNKCGCSEFVRQSSSGWRWGEADLYLAPCVHADHWELVVQSPSFPPPESVRSQPAKESQCSWYREFNMASSLKGAGRAWRGDPEISNSRKLLLTLA